MAVSSSPIQVYDEVDLTFLCLFFVLVYDMSIREEGRINDTRSRSPMHVYYWVFLTLFAPGIVLFR